MDDEELTHEALDGLIREAKSKKTSEGFKAHKRDLAFARALDRIEGSVLGILSARAATTTPPDTFVAGASTTNCPSRIPCYKYDATYSYPTGTCKFGCVPTAIAMIYGYHDRQGTYPNLITGGLAKDYIDSATTDTAITNMINSIRSSVGTFCNSGEGSTPAADAKL